MILSIFLIALGITLLIVSFTFKWSTVMRTFLALLAVISTSFGVFSIFKAFIDDDVSEVEEFLTEVEIYIENNDSIISTEEFILREFDVGKYSKSLVAELILEEKGEYYKFETTRIKESNSVDTPIVEYVKFEEDLVYENKGDIYIVSLTLPEGYLTNNKR